MFLVGRLDEWLVSPGVGEGSYFSKFVCWLVRLVANCCYLLIFYCNLIQKLIANDEVNITAGV